MRVTKKKLKLLNRSAAALLAISGGAMGLAHAQTAPVEAPQAAATDVATENNVGKVVVTARRREETLQDVPVSVTAYSAEQLSKQGIPDITALAFSLPNTTLKSSRATNSTLTAFIRGVGQQDPLAGFESGVGIYLDDIYLARPQGAVAEIYDVERIEVLRGPQGTLYGRNTIGGAVKYVTRKLAPTTDVRVKATAGNHGQLDGILTASTPLSETARVGASIAKFTRDGFGTNLTTGQGNYDKDLTAARISAEFTPTTDLFIRIAADATQDDSNPRNGHRLIVGRTSGAPILSNVFDTRANLTQALGHDQEVSAHGVSALIEWDISDVLTFKSVTASRRDKSYAPIDFDSLAATDFHVPALYKNKQFSQEFQVTYTGDKLQGVAGVYYIDANAFNIFDTILAAPFASSTFTKGDIDTKAWAVFADANYKINDAWSVSAGGRYTVDKREASILRQIYLGTGGSPELGNPAAVFFRTDTNFTNGELEREDKKFTPKVGVAYKMNDAHNVYGSFARGFKGGGFDPRMNVFGTKLSPAQARAGYAPETIDTFELGLKSSFNNDRFLTNIAVFNSDYKDVQIPGSVAVDTNGDGRDDSFAGVTTNAGKAKIKGFELEANARVTDNFTLSGMYSWIDAEYTRFIVAGVDQSANRVFQNTPKNSANLRAAYDIPMPIMGRTGRLTLSGNASYKDDTNQFETTSLLDQDAYTLWDASVVWTSANGKIRAGLHGKNLGDKEYKTGGYLFPTLGNEGVLTAFYGNPRTVSATLEYRF
ncbi:TonB-dependent receptor [Massilia sp. GCM10020059]|uniref:TonB-dependent receptor n=1 Tax=Massilia agrisoli TaxID=2892444 RepID=A0ABS8IWJ3_9BURK|nr:TonB-dependent receptor [Massilia agrisoli]MCC6072914.1 TonB-dependent receptor [Massilia agrisoli]